MEWSFWLLHLDGEDYSESHDKHQKDFGIENKDLHGYCHRRQTWVPQYIHCLGNADWIELE